MGGSANVLQIGLDIWIVCRKQARAFVVQNRHSRLAHARIRIREGVEISGRKTVRPRVGMRLTGADQQAENQRGSPCGHGDLSLVKSWLTMRNHRAKSVVLS